MMKTIAMLLAVSLAALLAGCNTVKGAGQDIQKAGTAIEKAADKNK
jgi:predicted small secreted protein